MSSHKSAARPDTGGTTAQMTEQVSGAAPVFSRARVWSGVVLLMLVGMVNTIDRILPGILVEPIKHDLALSDSVIGLINGFGFLVVYALVGIPIARLADRGAYGLVISACLGLWSLMTLAGAAAQTGWQLALTRMGVSLGEAGSAPATHAYIARNFPPNRRGGPLAVFVLSIPFASLIALMAGGLMGEALGWRMTFAIMAAVGLVLGPLVLFVLGPRQGAAPGTPPATLSLKPALGLLRKPSFLLVLCGTAFIAIGGYTLVTFSSAFLMRVHGMSLGEVGIRYGIAVGVSGVISVLLAGLSADRLSNRDPRWNLWVVVLMLAGLQPLGYTAFLTGNPWAAMFCMMCANIGASAYMAPVVAALQRLAPPDLRATASAFMFLFTGLAGGIGPLLAGLISDALQPEHGARALAYAMLVIPASQAVAALLYLAASLYFRRDMVAEAMDGGPAAP
jgi:predicted MFS family arabinose efflux permease